MNADLVAKLEAGATLVTPNRRLAQHLRETYDRTQQALGRACWRTPDILPLAVFVERCYDALSSRASVAEFPMRLNGAQEAALWEEAVSRSGAGLLSPSKTAAQCIDAWRIAHAWHILPRFRTAPLHDDARAFAAWAESFESACRKRDCIDSARCVEHVIAHAGRLGDRLPRELVAYGFDITPPQHLDLLRALTAAGCAVHTMKREPGAAQARRVACVSADAEIAACAQWARARLLDNPAMRIGIVVPGLAQRRSKLARMFTAALVPAAQLPGASRAAPPFDFSLGEPLADVALVKDALAILDLAGGRALDFEALSGLIRSPFLAGAEHERSQRALLDLELRKRCADRIALEAVLRMMQGVRRGVSPLLAERLASLAQHARVLRRQRLAPCEWGREFSALLGKAGFPGERGADSNEFQALQKLRETFATLATLETIAPRMRFDEALEHLKSIAAGTLFQVEAQPAPIRILGVLESSGLDFDALWVMGLTEEVWPMPARPNPFLPVTLQRAAGVPQSSAALALELDRGMTQGWLGAAPEVIVSHALHDGDRELLASPLIAHIAQIEDAAHVADDLYRKRLFAARRIETAGEESAPLPQRADATSAGAALFRDQAACPFRAFARHRLAAETPATPAPGLDAADRGTLLHDVLARVWTQLRNRQCLDAMPADELDTLLARAARDALEALRRRGVEILEGRFGELELKRLHRLVLHWLEYEKQREDFEVVACEQKREIECGGVRVRVKLDRLDRLRDGSHAIIDYKTGKALVASWLCERPDEPQLPLYCIGAQEDVAALVFARVRLGDDLKFSGIGRDEGLLPGVTPIGKQRSPLARNYASWDELVAGWRYELDALGRAFVAGDARVDPKYGANTCNECDLHALCRVGERGVVSRDGEGEENE
jgi:probable DNA repair protein